MLLTIQRWYLIWSRLVFDIRSEGITSTLYRGCRFLLRAQHKEDSFDKVNGVDTAAEVQPWKLQISSPNAKHGTKYETMSPEIFEQAVRATNVEPKERTFIDLGCGKGRPLIQAFRMGFSRIIGVEYSPELAEIAKTNCQKTQTNAEIATQDAAEFKLPVSDLLIYMANPFHEPVMRQVLASFCRHKKKLAIIYVNAQLSHLLDECPKLARIGTSNNAILWELRDPTSDDCQA